MTTTKSPFGEHFYSVPFTLIHEEVRIRASEAHGGNFTTKGQREPVAVHPRSSVPGRYSTQPPICRPSTKKRGMDRGAYVGNGQVKLVRRQPNSSQSILPPASIPSRLSVLPGDICAYPVNTVHPLMETRLPGSL